jgi:hypothetical protein
MGNHYRNLEKVKLSLSLTNYALPHEDVGGNGCIDPRFLDLSTSQKRVVSYTHLLLYPRRMIPLHLFDRRFGAPPS